MSEINRSALFGKLNSLAYKAIEGAVMKQAAVLSYMDVFLYIGILFVICIPFVILVRGNKKRKGEKLDLSAAH